MSAMRPRMNTAGGNARLGTMRVTDRNSNYLREIANAGLGSIADGVLTLNRRGVSAFQNLIDTDPEANRFFNRR